MANPALSYIRPRFRLADKSGEQETVNRPGPLALDIVLVPRRFCSFSREKLTARSIAARRALALRIQHSQAFDDAQVRVVPDAEGLTAGVWAWQQQGLWRPREANKGRFVLPESLARKGLSDGARIVRCHQGVEGEVWQDGALIASRWWFQQPEQGEWLLFLRAAGLEPEGEDMAVPPVSDPEWVESFPPAAYANETLAGLFSPMRLAIATSALALFFAAFFLGQIGFATFSAAQAERRQAQLLEENSDILRARLNAVSAQGEAQLIAALSDSHTLLSTLAIIADEFADKEAELQGITLRAGEATVIVDSEQQINSPELVKRLETNALFEEVFVEDSGGGRITIRTMVPSAVIQQERL